MPRKLELKTTRIINREVVAVKSACLQTKHEQNVRWRFDRSRFLVMQMLHFRWPCATSLNVLGLSSLLLYLLNCVAKHAAIFSIFFPAVNFDITTNQTAHIEFAILQSESISVTLFSIRYRAKMLCYVVEVIFCSIILQPSFAMFTRCYAMNSMWPNFGRRILDIVLLYYVCFSLRTYDIMFILIYYYVWWRFLFDDYIYRLLDNLFQTWVSLDLWMYYNHVVLSDG